MPIQTYAGTVTKIHILTPTVRGLDVTLDNATTIEYKTGQWVNLHLTHNNIIIKRAFSIASPAYEKITLHFCVKRVEHGIGSAILFSFEEGDKVSLSGPFGHFTLKPTKNNIVLIATGSGVAPFRAMLLSLFDANVTNTITLLFGNRTEDEIIYHDLFQHLVQDHPNFSYRPILSRPGQNWKGETGHVQDLIKKHINVENKNQDFYICGLKDMVLNVKALLEELGFPKEQIYFERYT